MALALALGAALLYATASVLQQRAAAASPPEQSMRVSLLAHLVRHPLWVAGIAADVAAYALQFLALDRGALVLVQPLLVSGLLFALPLSTIGTTRRMSRRDWMGAVEVVAGLALFLVVTDPRAGRGEASGTAWAVVLVATVVPVAVLVVAARRSSGGTRAVLLGAAAGTLYGLTAALTKATGHLLSGGLLTALSAWEPYALALFGVVGLLLAQSAFQASNLGSSLPALTVSDPLVSIAIGAWAFGEGITVGGLAPVLEVAGLAAMVAGVFTLARGEGSTAPGGEPSPADTSPRRRLP